jgi:hypothetical protein
VFQASLYTSNLGGCVSEYDTNSFNRIARQVDLFGDYAAFGGDPTTIANTVARAAIGQRRRHAEQCRL